MNNALELFSEFEAITADGFPLGETGGEVLAQIERVSKLVEEAKAYYKHRLAKDPHCIPGWTLKPGATRRSLANPQRVWEKLQDTLTTEQFLCAVKIEVGKLQDLWTQVSGIPAARAKELFNKELGDLVIELQSAPSLVRAKL
jgi:uncharacterized protein DUF2800